MPEDVATNLVPRPFPGEGRVSPAWILASGSGAPVGPGRDNFGNPYHALRVGNKKTVAKPTNAPHAELGEFDAGTVFQYDVDFYAGGTISSATKVSFGAVTRLNQDLAGTANYDEQIIPGGTYSASKPYRISGSMTATGGGTQWFRLAILTGEAFVDVVAARVYVADEPDELGIFDGDGGADPDRTYAWTGEPELSSSTATLAAVEPDPDPDPDPGDGDGEPSPADPVALGKRVAAHLGQPDDTELIALANVHAETVTDYVWGYTRGRGFTDEVPDRLLRSVIVAATARLTSNPEQVSYYVAGDYSERPAVLAGWLLHELAVLNKYRRRYA